MLETGFQALVDANYAKVFYHSLKLTGNEHDAADVTQNTFLKAFLRYDAVRKRESLEPWLFVICNNEIRQFYRSHQKTAPAPERWAPPDNAALYAAIDRLSEAQRQAVLLKYFAGYTMEEIALARSTHVSTVKSRLYEARQSLKNSLSAQELPALPTLQIERRHYLMSMLNLCAVGAKTIPCMSLRGQKELLRCAKDNAKFSAAVLSELADIPSGQEFLDDCGGSLSYGELVAILACTDEATLYRISGQDYRTWRNAAGSPLIKDVAELYKTGGYVDSVEMILYVPSMRDTVEWYKKHLNWSADSDEEEMEKWGHVILSPYTNESAKHMYKDFRGFHLRLCCEDWQKNHPGRISQNQGKFFENCGCFVFVSGLEELREAVIKTGLEQVGEIWSYGWGTRSFSITDLNGLTIEFCEWEC
ncbi:MAG: sigma-70 family RNA polymerase sigma factor [Defluviitaleaceae bacterium]|nr:sigma-70 family RNA polymerase sigma factor [Defluviitaleaceae bacterium]